MPSGEQGADIDNRTLLDVIAERPIVNTLTLIGGAALAAVAVGAAGDFAGHVWHEAKEAGHEKFNNFVAYLRDKRGLLQ